MGEDSGPVQLAPGVYWVGYVDTHAGFHCNPYLIVDGDEAVLIDGGSRPDFSTVMRKILQTGVAPESISTLIYQHYDPDLCGSIPNFIDIIDRPGLRILSKHENNPFIRHYSLRVDPSCIDELGRTLVFGKGRRLRFIPTPYAHAPGSFMTLDERTGVLFTSDLLGAFGLSGKWQLIQQLSAECASCTSVTPDDPHVDCDAAGYPCPWTGLCHFHRMVMPSNAALRLALDRIADVDPAMVAPQHGSVLNRRGDIAEVIQRLRFLDDVGIDGILRGRR
ncbi:MAG: MBL fold metallo-hydrolase [Magnetococcus sp. WYHC-3]